MWIVDNNRFCPLFRKFLQTGVIEWLGRRTSNNGSQFIGGEQNLKALQTMLRDFLEVFLRVGRPQNRQFTFDERLALSPPGCKVKEMNIVSIGMFEPSSYLFTVPDLVAAMLAAIGGVVGTRLEG